MGYTIKSSLFMILSGLIFSVPSYADLPRGAEERLQKDIKSMYAAIQSARKNDSIPLLSDDKHKRVFKKLVDRKGVLGSGPYVSKDVNSLINMAGAYKEIIKQYTFYTPAGSIIPDFKNNEILYQNELAAFYEFFLYLNAATIQSLDKFVEELDPTEMTEIRRSGLAQARLGMSQIIEGILITIDNPDISNDNKIKYVNALTDTAQHFALILDKKSRKQISKLSGSARKSKITEVRKGFNYFVTIINNANCTNICLIK